MAIIDSFIDSSLVAWVVLSCVFIIAYLHKQRFDLIDSAWGLMFVAIAWYNFFAAGTRSLSGGIMAGMVSIWGVRLSTHIFRRWIYSPAEDARYAALRRNWPSHLIVPQTYIRIYLVQIILGCIISLPVIIYMRNQSAIDAWNLIGATIWLVGISIEATADRQLAQHIRHSKESSLMTKGLWRYSRHPNYFGELLLWWGIAIFAIGAPFGWLGLIGALAITLLLLFVSGVPLAEKRTALRPGWQAYASRTSVIVPWPPRHT